MANRRPVVPTGVLAGCLAAFVVAALAVPAQAPGGPVAVPSFDVISVKPDKDSQDIRVGFTSDGVHGTGVPVRFLLTEGFLINRDQLVGEPGWVSGERFTVDAKVAGADAAAFTKLTFDQRRSMFRQILIEQFKLTTHTETRQLPVYEMSIARGGAKFKETAPPAPGTDPNLTRDPMFYVGRGKLTVQNGPASSLAFMLSRTLGRKVIDKTGLTGRYDFALEWTPDDAGGVAAQARTDGAAPSMAPDSAPSIFTAIQEQLGLKLEPAKGPVECVVIDHIERPTEN